MLSQETYMRNKKQIFEAINKASPTVNANAETREEEALALLDMSEYARPKLLAEDPTEAMCLRIQAGLVIGTSCERISKLTQLPDVAAKFLKEHHLPPKLKLQNIVELQSLDWQTLKTDIDVREDKSVGLCLAEYGIAETGSFVVHSCPEMPILLNFLPLYLIAVVPKSRVLHYLDDYALIANGIAKQNKTPRNMCIISGVSGTTDIEGVLVQGAHGPKLLHIIIVEDQ